METAANSDHKGAGKNLVICCDGSGNEISENISKALKLYRCLSKDGHDAAAADGVLRFGRPARRSHP